jgi:hypothetical protein
MARTGFLDQFARVLGPTRLDDQVGHVHRGAGAHGLPGRSAAGGGLQLGDVLADVGVAGRCDHWGLVGRHGDCRPGASGHRGGQLRDPVQPLLGRRRDLELTGQVGEQPCPAQLRSLRHSAPRPANPGSVASAPGRGISLPQPCQRHEHCSSYNARRARRVWRVHAGGVCSRPEAQQARVCDTRGEVGRSRRAVCVLSP